MHGYLKPLVMLALAAGTAGASPPLEEPVMIGGNPDIDACPSMAQVTGLGPGGNSFLAVRSRPAVEGRALAHLGPDRLVWVCGESADGQWTAIVFAPAGATMDCGVGTPSRRKPYAGPCESGWVASRYLVIVAG